MTKEEAVAEFKEYVLPGIQAQYEQDGRPDWPARQQAWNDFTDMLQKDRRITMRQYETWTHPSITAGPRGNPVNWMRPNPFRLPIPNTRPGPFSWESRFAVPTLVGNPRRCPRGLEVATILFPVDEFTVKQAKAWAKSHGKRYGKVDTTENYHRLRQRDPDDFTEGSMRTIEFGESGIKAVTGCPRPGMERQ